MKNKKRIVIHVDVYNFFTAVEERGKAEFKGKAVIVGADPKEGEGRGGCQYLQL
jgi:nucleotidyltransferase/DNA polymerase involved in DNA repair